MVYLLLLSSYSFAADRVFINFEVEKFDEYKEKNRFDICMIEAKKKCIEKEIQPALLESCKAIFKDKEKKIFKKVEGSAFCGYEQDSDE